MKKNLSTQVLVIIAFSAFIMLGMPDAMLGVAWPSMRNNFGVSLDVMGLLLLPASIGYLLASFGSGRLVSAFGIGSMLLTASALRSLGLLGYGWAPNWTLMLLTSFATGLGSGMVDASLNIFFATHMSPRLTNWLHACYGLGSTLGPLLMTQMIQLDLWRWAYWLTAGLQGAVTLAFGLTAQQWNGKNEGSTTPQSEPSAAASVWETLKHAPVWLSIAVFFAYSGNEVTAGQWSFTLLTESRSVAAETAGFWVSVYWASLTVGRVLFGAIANRVRPTLLLRGSMLSAVLGATLIAQPTYAGLNNLGLSLLGLSLAPIFPLLIANTPKRLGEKHTANAVGFQMAAAGLGVATLPWLAGILADHWHLEVIGPYLLLLLVVMLFLGFAVTQRDKRSI